MIIHFELSQPDGDCYRRAKEVERQKGFLDERELRGGEAEGSRRKQQEAPEVECLKEVPVERELRGGKAEGSSRKL